MTGYPQTNEDGNEVIPDFPAMVGSTIVAVLASKNQDTMAFVARGGRVFLWTTFADCCSETWFADIEGMENLIGREITAIEQVEMPQPKEGDGRSRQESDEFYGIKITTTAGFVDIVYRNSSNGYYGGNASCSITDSVPADLDELDVSRNWRAPLTPGGA